MTSNLAMCLAVGGGLGLLGVAIGLWVAGGGRPATAFRRVVVFGLCCVLSVFVTWVLFRPDPVTLLPAINDILRIGPSIFGEAGSGVKEFL